MSIEKKLLGTTPPTGIDGTDVFSADAYSGTGGSLTVTNDIDLSGEGGLIIFKSRSTHHPYLFDTERGIDLVLQPNSINDEDDFSFLNLSTATDGWGLNSSESSLNSSSGTYVAWVFRKAESFFDIVTYTGNGSTQSISHNLVESAPKMMIVKARSSSSYDWYVYHVNNVVVNQYVNLGPEDCYLRMNNTGNAGDSVDPWNSTLPTSTHFYVGASGDTNANATTYVAYLFGDRDGISKCGTYSGNGSNQNIDCGFSDGARFVFIKCSTNAGDWYIWDTSRGINSGSDPHLKLNPANNPGESNADSIDYYSGGFNVVQNGTTNINDSNGPARYIFLAIA